MIRTTVDLISLTQEQDLIGQVVNRETKKTVLAEIRNASMSEWTSAGQLGISAEYQVKVISGDYDNQRLVNYAGKRYRVYRVYRDSRYTELYLEEAVGHAADRLQ